MRGFSRRSIGVTGPPARDGMAIVAADVAAMPMSFDAPISTFTRWSPPSSVFSVTRPCTFATSPGHSCPSICSVVSRKSLSGPLQSDTKRPNNAWSNMVLTNMSRLPTDFE